jgi:hypothetical protein
MSIPTDYKDLIEELSVATKKGRVLWKVKKFRMEVTISDTKFSLHQNTNNTTKRSFITLSLLDQNDHLLDTWDVDEGENDFDLIKDLYDGAKREALSLPERLSSIREELLKSAIIGEPLQHD